MATPKMLTERQQLAIALRESMSDAPAGAVSTPVSATKTLAASPASDEVRRASAAVPHPQPDRRTFKNRGNTRERRSTATTTAGAPRSRAVRTRPRPPRALALTRPSPRIPPHIPPQGEPKKRKMSRVEKELASLAPWAWDPRGQARPRLRHDARLHGSGRRQDRHREHGLVPIQPGWAAPPQRRRHTRARPRRR